MKEERGPTKKGTKQNTRGTKFVLFVSFLCFLWSFVADLCFVILMAHRVDHEVQRYADCVAGIFFGITIEIHKFPGVT